MRPDDAVPPMDLVTLLAEGEASGDVVRAAAELVALKAVSRETGAGAVPGPLARFVDDELARASEAMEPGTGRAAARTRAAEAFRSMVVRYGPDPSAWGTGRRLAPGAAR